MNNPFNILPKQASFDLKSSKMGWRLGQSLRRSPDPVILRDIAPSALATHYFVSISRSQIPFLAPPLLNSWIRHWVLHLYIYIALLAVRTNQKHCQCERPREKRAVKTIQYIIFVDRLSSAVLLIRPITAVGQNTA